MYEPKGRYMNLRTWPWLSSFHLSKSWSGLSSLQGSFPTYSSSVQQRIDLEKKKSNFWSFNLFSFFLQAIVMFAIIFPSAWKRKAILNLGFGGKRKLQWESSS